MWQLVALLETKIAAGAASAASNKQQGTMRLVSGTSNSYFIFGVICYSCSCSLSQVVSELAGFLLVAAATDRARVLVESEREREREEELL